MIFGKRSQLKEAAEEQRERIITYKRTFGTPEGKAVLFDLMNRFHILNTHQGNVLQEGERSAVLYILSQCNINLTDFDKLLKGENE